MQSEHGATDRAATCISPLLFIARWSGKSQRDSLPPSCPEHPHTPSLSPSLLLQMVEDSQLHLEKTLSKILVEMLLDPTTSLPLDVDSMHKKMIRGPAGERCGLGEGRDRWTKEGRKGGREEGHVGTVARGLPPLPSIKHAIPPCRYERVMVALGLHSVAPLIYKLGTPPLGLLEALVVEISGRVKTFVTNMDRMGLSRCGAGGAHGGGGRADQLVVR